MEDCFLLGITINDLMGVRFIGLSSMRFDWRVSNHSLLP